MAEHFSKHLPLRGGILVSFPWPSMNVWLLQPMQCHWGDARRFWGCSFHCVHCEHFLLESWVTMRAVWLSHNAVSGRPCVSFPVQWSPSFRIVGPALNMGAKKPSWKWIPSPSLSGHLYLAGHWAEVPADSGAEGSLLHCTLSECQTHRPCEHHKAVVASHH